MQIKSDLPKPMNLFFYIILSSIALAPLFTPQAVEGLTTTGVNDAREAISIGAIVDYDSRAGKEAKVAMEMAFLDFSTSNFILHFRNSQSKPFRAAFAAKDLIDAHEVKAIIGTHTWEEASSIAGVATDSHHNISILSLADSSPPWATTDQWLPFLLQASPNQCNAQTKAIAAIIQSWGWHHITFIYENTLTLSASGTRLLSQLSHALRQVNAEMTRIFPITSSSSSSMVEELEKLKGEKNRIFVVHTSSELGFRLFQNANKIGMMEEGFAWIATNGITDLFHSVDPTTISSLNGILGVKSYFPENSPEFQEFRKRFLKKFKTEFPDEESGEPGVFAAQAYDAARVVSSAMLNKTQNLLERISVTEFNGLSGVIKFTDRTLAPASVVEIVNVIGKSYNSGYWTNGLGFSKAVEDGAAYKSLMHDLGQVFWPEQPWYAQTRRRILAGSPGTPLRVGVPTESLFKQFVNVKVDSQNNLTSYDGFSIAVFNETMKRLSPNLEIEFRAYPGAYDDILRLVPKDIDAVAGDVTIVESRQEYVDFTQPYTEAGLEMIVPVRSRLPSRTWLFMKPFTTSMWGLIAAFTLYNGFTVWLIEREDNTELQRSSLSNQIGTLLYVSFTTLFTLHGGKQLSNLSRMAMVVWLFVALIIIQTYTASLASMLTAQMLEPSIKDVETLMKMNATVGYCKGSFINAYLKDVLGFDSIKTKKYSSTKEYAEALNTGEIAAIFLEVPSAKVFLAQYCKSFIRTGETFKVGGFGFAFLKGYSLLQDINKALLNVTENKAFKDIEDKYILSEKCTDVDVNRDEDPRISPDSLWILFALTGGTSTVALAIYAIVGIGPEHKSVFRAMIKQSQHQRRQCSSRVSNAEIPQPSPSAFDPLTHV